MKKMAAVLLAVFFSGCSTVGKVGLITKEGVGLAEVTASKHQDLGPVQGKACRYIWIGLFSSGDNTTSKALQIALEKSGGNALKDVTEKKSLYHWIYPYSVLTVACTAVQGTAVRLSPHP